MIKFKNLKIAKYCTRDIFVLSYVLIYFFIMILKSFLIFFVYEDESMKSYRDVIYRS